MVFFFVANYNDVTTQLFWGLTPLKHSWNNLVSSFKYHWNVLKTLMKHQAYKKIIFIWELDFDFRKVRTINQISRLTKDNIGCFRNRYSEIWINLNFLEIHLRYLKHPWNLFEIPLNSLPTPLISLEAHFNAPWTTFETPG